MLKQCRLDFGTNSHKICFVEGLFFLSFSTSVNAFPHKVADLLTQQKQLITIFRILRQFYKWNQNTSGIYTGRFITWLQRCNFAWISRSMHRKTQWNKVTIVSHTAHFQVGILNLNTFQELGGGEHSTKMALQWKTFFSPRVSSCPSVK